MWDYFRLTGDDSLLLEGGAEVILECARFYYSYAYYKRDKRRYEILDVIGPDEYHERVNNNAFTSMVAKETLTIAIETVIISGESIPRSCAPSSKAPHRRELPAFPRRGTQAVCPGSRSKDRHHRAVRRLPWAS
jgi:nigerose phosphorylase